MEDEFKSSANVNGSSASAHHEQAVHSLMFLHGITKEEAEKRMGKKEKVSPPGWITHIVNTYHEVRRYKTVGMAGENPLTMRDIASLEESTFKLSWWEVEMLFTIDSLVMAEQNKAAAE